MKILVVDDAMIIRMQMKNFLKNEMKYEEVLTANDGIEAFEMYKEHTPNLVFLDLTMPNKDGIDALEDIIKLDPKARVIIVSAVKDTAKITKALQLGAKTFINKPLDFKSPEFVLTFKDEIEAALED